jgi:hypothetical protein
VGPRAVLDAVVKRIIPSPLRESNPRTPSSPQPNAIPTELSRLSTQPGTHINLVPKIKNTWSFTSAPIHQHDVVFRPRHITFFITLIITNIMRSTTPLNETSDQSGIGRLVGGWKSEGWEAVPHRISQYRPPQLPAPAGRIVLRRVDIINPGFEASSIKTMRL